MNLDNINFKKIEKCLPHPTIAWTVESRGVIIFDRHSGTSCFLNYPDAAVWDMLLKGYPPQDIALLLSAIDRPDVVSATEKVRCCLSQWLKAGFINSM